VLWWCARSGGSPHDPQRRADLTAPGYLLPVGAAVISVAPLAGGGGAAAYYLQRDAGCEHEHTRDALGYYVNTHEPAGHWLGSGAAALGLTGPLGPDGEAVLRELLDGRLAGEELARPVYRYTEDGSRADVRRSGYDVTFSAPKSVSVLMGLGNQEVAAQVRAAHTAAMTDAVGLLETLAARAARGHQGDGQRAPRIPTSGVIGAAFEHHTSRADDPQLHTHVLLLNLAQGFDGRWSALDSRTLHRQATTASYLYQARLRAELTSRLGLKWTAVERGVAEIEGIPKSLCRVFSTRRRQIEAHLEGREDLTSIEGGRRPGRVAQLAARAACLITRPAKQHTPPQSRRTRWWSQATQTGFTEADLRTVLHPGQEAGPIDEAALSARVLSQQGVTRERASFDQGAVLRELCQQLPAGVDISTHTLLRLTARIVRRPDVVPVLSPDGPAYTTLDMLATEQQALSTVARRDHDDLLRSPAATVTGPVVRSGLRSDQQLAVLHLLTSGRGVEVVTGPAGSGKTAALRVATEHWAQSGVQVAGTAVAALTAQGLQDATGAPSVSLARLLHHPDLHLPSGGVLLVDEAGMIGTRTLTELLELTGARGCKLVLVGDPAQLPELEAGGLFAALAQRPETLHLDGHHRQRESWERVALAALRCGEVERAFDSYEQHGRLHTASNRTDLHTQAVERYLGARAEADDPWQVAILAARRSEVRQLNELVRASLIADGRLGHTELQVETDQGQVEYRAGDQVLITRNDHSRGLLNGTTAIVDDLGNDALTLRTTDGRRVTVNRDWLEQGQLDHGYALTIHKAQGRTVHTALLVGDARLDAEAGYVGLSRGTHANHLFLDVADSPRDELDCSSNPRWRKPVWEHMPLDNALQHSRAQQLASTRLAEGRGR
jgi:conjugative relaxase-like TrwC/TraI family protein